MKGTHYYWDPQESIWATREQSTSNKPIRLAPYIIPDSMPQTWHPANNKRYESKSIFRKVTRDHGCIEVGNEEQKQKPSEPKDSDYEEAILRAWDNPRKIHVDRIREFDDIIVREAIEKANR